MSTTEFIVLLAVVTLVFVGVLALAHVHGLGNLRKLKQVKYELRGLAEYTFEKAALRAIHVQCVTSLQFAMRSEDGRTVSMRERGALVEMQTDDYGFDDKIFLECDDTRVGDWLRSDAEARALITSLVGRTRTVVLSGGRLSLVAGELPTAGGVLPEYARLLRNLAERVPSTKGADPVTAPQRTRLRVVRGISFLVLGVGIVAAGWAMADHILNPFPQHASLIPLLLVAALVGAAPATWAFVLALRAVRETSHAARLVPEFVVSIWVPIVAVIAIAVHQFNLKVVVGREHVEETELVDLYSKRWRRSTSYYLVLPALDGGRIPTARYDSTWQINKGLRAGQRVRVYWRDGVLASSLITRAPEPLTEG